MTPVDPQKEAIGRITASLGVALFPGHADETDSRMRAADEALYHAKGDGRDRVVAATFTSIPPQRARFVVALPRKDARMHHAVRAVLWSPQLLWPF